MAITSTQPNYQCYHSVLLVLLLQAILLDAAMKQIKQTQLSVNKTMELLASVHATVDGYLQTRADLNKAMGDLKSTVDTSQKSMENMRSDMASHQVMT